MKIIQGYQSQSMSAFEYVKSHKLKPYYDPKQPLVVFGCYDKDDLRVILNHQSTVVVQWEGLDSKKWNDLGVFKNRWVYNVTPHPNIQAYFEQKGLQCNLVRWAMPNNDTFNPQVLGDKVYTYINKNNRSYYGGHSIKKINTPYPIIIGDYTLNTTEWTKGPKDEMYAQAFIGLQLSPYAGGGNSIVELGLRGIKVVTNVLRLPHCIPWKMVEDIEKVINEEAKNIGTVNKELAQEVYDSVLCAEKITCYDLDQLLIQK